MRIATLVKKVAAARKEKEGIKRLLAAVAAETAQPPIRVYGGHVDTTPELPVVHAYSEVWNFVELDPNKWH